jgi:hypothetical protein
MAGVISWVIKKHQSVASVSVMQAWWAEQTGELNSGRIVCGQRRLTGRSFAASSLTSPKDGRRSGMTCNELECLVRRINTKAAGWNSCLRLFYELREVFHQDQDRFSRSDHGAALGQTPLGGLIGGATAVESGGSQPAVPDNEGVMEFVLCV